MGAFFLVVVLWLGRSSAQCYHEGVFDPGNDVCFCQPNYMGVVCEERRSGYPKTLAVRKEAPDRLQFRTRLQDYPLNVKLTVCINDTTWNCVQLYAREPFTSILIPNNTAAVTIYTTCMDVATQLPLTRLVFAPDLLLSDSDIAGYQNTTPNALHSMCLCYNSSSPTCSSDCACTVDDNATPHGHSVTGIVVGVIVMGLFIVLAVTGYWHYRKKTSDELPPYTEYEYTNPVLGTAPPSYATTAL